MDGARLAPAVDFWAAPDVDVRFADSLDCYSSWGAPDVIVSDGAYGLGFEGDAPDHSSLAVWYEPHVRAWAQHAKLSTTLWFWNTEIGWVIVHPVLERYGFRYVNANVWNKGVAHAAGNVDLVKIRRFPVVTELCVQYVVEPRIGDRLLKRWLLDEWDRTGLLRRVADEACGVRAAATRKYLNQGHLWYWPPVEMFRRLADYANVRGRPEGRPYFSRDGRVPITSEEWAGTRAKFRCPYGVTNVWDEPAVRGVERVKNSSGRIAHPNQKPLSLMTRIVEASSDEGDVVWEPFGGLFTAAVASMRAGRRVFGAEIDPAVFQLGVDRLRAEVLG